MLKSRLLCTDPQEPTTQVVAVDMRPTHSRYCTKDSTTNLVENFHTIVQYQAQSAAQGAL